MSEELKPCPFCGCKNIIVRKYTAVAGVHYYVQCDSTNGGCGANIDSRTTKKSAVEAWNKRTDEVRHGEWIDVPLNSDPNDWTHKYNLRTKCSACGFAMPREYPRYNICPHCGAKMDGGKTK